MKVYKENESTASPISRAYKSTPIQTFHFVALKTLFHNDINTYINIIDKVYFLKLGRNTMYIIMKCTVYDE